MATPNMSLSLPTPSITLGPAWASQLNLALESVDSHDHSSGKGVRITPPGININSDLAFNSNNVNSVRSLRLSTNSAVLAGPQDIRSVYSKDGDLYYNNASGTAVQITSGSSTTSGAAGPSVSYSRTQSSSSTFNINPSDTFSYVDLVTLSNAITVNLPAANSVAAGRFYFIKDSYGNATVNNITIVPNGGNTIDGASSVVIGANYDGFQLISDGSSRWNLIKLSIPNGSVTRVKQASVGQQISSTTGFFTTASTSYVDVTNLSVSITTTGRPVMILLQGTTNDAQGSYISGAGATIAILRNGTQISLIKQFSGVTIVPSSILFLDTPAAGTYTYKIQTKASGGSPNSNFSEVKLVAYEL